MKEIKRYGRVGSLLLLVLLVAGCASVPLTGRRQISLVSDAEVAALSQQQYRAFVAKAPKSRNASQTARVRQTGTRIARATEQYLRAAGREQDLRYFDWEFNLIASPQVNAFCMPGGKIVVYEGILPVASRDDELATVVAHEVAHAVAKHSAERLSQAILEQYGARALGLLLSGESAGVQALGSVLYSVGGKFIFELPYSRKQEYEADRIGLYLMALAGYDYHHAVDLWTKMARQDGGGNGSEVLSTHPNDQNRIRAIREEIPRVEAFVRGGGRTVPAATQSPSGGKVPLVTHY